MSAFRFDNTIVTNMMEEALEFCAEKAGRKGKEQAREALRNGDCCVCEYLRYALAKKVAEYLGSVDETVKVIYTYEPEYTTTADGPIADRPNLTPGVNLLVWVSRKSAALSSVVASVNSALVRERERLSCPKANALCYELDVKMADDDEVRRRIGYGALVNSFYVRPMEIWHR